MAIDTKAKLLKRRRTRIVATLGPASNSEEMISRLVAVGVDVFRLNLSHGSHDEHRRVFGLVRKAAEAAAAPVAILGDLSGPKIRVGRFEEGGIELESGHEVTVTTRDVLGRAGLIPSQYEPLARDVEIGSAILLDDGNLELEVIAIDGTEIRCRVVRGGRLRDRKGMNLPGVAVSCASLTDKDRDDARFLVELGVDLLALSFVRRADDLRDLRALVGQRGGGPALIAKIEKPEALEDIDDILEASDGIMVARGDLGVELPPEEVPVVQHQLIDLARARNRPVIVATQMLESMIERARPTRAEVTDVAQAVVAGADAVMLSAETAAGAYPVESVSMMNRIARQTEAYQWKRRHFAGLGRDHEEDGEGSLGPSVAKAMAQLSRDLSVRSIVILSESGTTARVMVSARPAAPVLAASTDAATCRRMNLLWGTVPIQIEPDELKDPSGLAARLAVKLDLAEAGQTILLLRGFSADPERSAPSLTVLRVPD